MAVKKEVSIESIDKAKKALTALPAKQPAKKMVDDALQELKPQIEAALARGYSKTELVELFGKQGLPIKAYHLKRLLTTKRTPAPETPAA